MGGGSDITSAAMVYMTPGLVTDSVIFSWLIATKKSAGSYTNIKLWFGSIFWIVSWGPTASHVLACFSKVPRRNVRDRHE